MPRYKRRYRRRRRKPFNLAIRNAAKLKQIQKGIEHKFDEEERTAVDIDDAGDTVFIGTIAQGGATSQRIGSKILMKNLHIRGYINEEGNGSDGIGRVLVVRWKKKDEATTIGITDVLNTVHVNSLYNLDNSGNYKVYYDETFPIDTTQNSNIPFKINVKLNSIRQYNTDAAGDEGDVTANSMYVMFFSTIATGADCPHMQFKYRLSYVDN